MALSPEQAAALALAYQQAMSEVRDRVTAAVEASWLALSSWRDEDIARFVRAVLPIVLGGQQAMAGLVSAYLADSRSAALDVPPRPVGVRLDRVTGAAVRNGTPPGVVYRRAGEQVWRDLGAGKPLGEAVDHGMKRAVKAARTDLQRTKTLATREVIRGDADAVGFRRVVVGEENCALCIVASTQRYTRKELLPIHPGCVPEGTPVSARGVVALTRRRYSGELVVIRTATGDEVTVTPNHPVLTDQGWVPADLVNDGHDVVRHGGRHWAVGGGPEEHHRPALVEDVWRAACVSGRLVRVPLAPEDFHGDGSDGEVDVVYPDGLLAGVRGVSFAEPVRELVLVPGHGGRLLLDGGGAEGAFLPRGRTAGRSDMGGGSLRLALLGGHLCCAHQSGVRAAATFDAAVSENPGDSASADAVLDAQRVFRGTSVVLVDDLLVRQDNPGPGPLTRFDPAGAEFSGDGALTYARLGRALVDRLAGEVELDRVVQVVRVDYTGHVYNLHTSEGWYTSDSHIVSNCDCDVAPIFGPDPGQVIDEETLAAAHEAIMSTFGISDAAARNPDYRKLILVRNHSELGPLLTVKSHRFTGPEALKSKLDLSGLPGGR